jgi:hypothetical protein
MSKTDGNKQTRMRGLQVSNTAFSGGFAAYAEQVLRIIVSTSPTERLITDTM